MNARLRRARVLLSLERMRLPRNNSVSNFSSYFLVIIVSSWRTLWNFFNSRRSRDYIHYELSQNY